MSNKIQRAITAAGERVLALDVVYFDRLFALVLLILVGAILVATPQYSREAQLFPLTIGVPTFLMLIAIVAMLFSDRAKAFARGFSTADLFGVGDQIGGGDEGAGEAMDPIEARHKITAIILWIAALLLLIYLVGFLIGIIVFLVAYYRFSAEQPWTRTLLYSAFVWGFIYGMFIAVLNTPLYEGIIVEWIIDYLQ